MWSTSLIVELGMRRDSNATAENGFKIEKKDLSNNVKNISGPRFIWQHCMNNMARLKNRKNGNLDSTRVLKIKAVNDSDDEASHVLNNSTEKWKKIRKQKNRHFTQGKFTDPIEERKFQKYKSYFDQRYLNNYSTDDESETEKAFNMIDNSFDSPGDFSKDSKNNEFIFNDNNPPNSCSINVHYTENKESVIKKINVLKKINIKKEKLDDNIDKEKKIFKRNSIIDNMQNETASKKTKTIFKLPDKNSLLFIYENFFNHNFNYPQGFPFPSDYKLCKAGFEIENFELNKLDKYQNGNQWIGDEVINLFFKFLEDFGQKKRKLKIKCLITNLAQQVIEKQQISQGLATYLTKLKLSNQQILLIPIANALKTHWMLIVLIIPLKKIVYLDSLNGSCPPLMNKFASVIIRKFIQKNDTLTDWLLHSPNDIPTQRMETRIHDVVGGNCGVHICAWGYTIMSGCEYEFTEGDMDTVRRSIMNILYFEKIPKPNKEPRIRADPVPVFVQENDPYLLEEEHTVPLNHEKTIDFFKSLHIFINPHQRNF